ncbi:hypothetical protein [Streptomyces sp. NPDC047042]|uniref:hypothetical protein n=1 Tax=Streptomyces sp. NPDC047042 TaxID=3154807 RepID=UPI0033C3BAAD
MKIERARLARCFLALGMLAALTGCGDDKPTVTIIVPWSGDEFQAFKKITDAFPGDAVVDVQSTRALGQHLDSAVEGGNPPDLAVLPNPGAIRSYADTKDGKGLQEIASETPFLEPFAGLTTVAKVKNPGVYAVPIKVDVKSLTWYALKGPRPLTGRWCLGLESGATTGWPGADWIADILLRTKDTETYEKWATGHSEWPSQQDAWAEWRGLVQDSDHSALVTNFRGATTGMAEKNSGCQQAHGALAAMGFQEKLKNYTFEAPKPNVPLQVSADYVGMFNTRKPTTELIKYLTKESTQRKWVNDEKSSAFSAVKTVTPGKYPPGVKREIAKLLAPNARRLCFSAADMMKPDLASAFYRAVVDYYAKDPVSREAQETLERDLASLSVIQSTIHDREPPRKICTTPRRSS